MPSPRSLAEQTEREVADSWFAALANLDCGRGRGATSTPSPNRAVWRRSLTPPCRALRPSRNSVHALRRVQIPLARLLDARQTANADLSVQSCRNFPRDPVYDPDIDQAVAFDPPPERCSGVPQHPGQRIDLVLEVVAGRAREPRRGADGRQWHGLRDMPDRDRRQTITGEIGRLAHSAS